MSEFSIDPKLPVTEQNNIFKVKVKTAFVEALRTSLQDLNYPDKKIQGINVSMEYPMEENLYPHIWVQFSFSKFQQAGIGHQFISENQLKQEFYFEGVVRFQVIALSSYERDVYASELMQLLAFSKMHPVVAKFDDVLESYPGLYLSINRDNFIPEGETVELGTAWSEKIMTYSDAYNIQVIGQMESSFTVDQEFLRSLQFTAVGEGALSTDLNVTQTFAGENQNRWL